MTKIFSKEYLVEELDLPWNAVHDEVVGTEKWSVYHDMVFQDVDGKYYMAFYKDEVPWEYEDEVECTEVELRDVTVKKWMPVE